MGAEYRNLYPSATGLSQEVAYGLALNPTRAKVLAPVLALFFDASVTLHFDEGDAQAAGALRAALKVRGKPIGAYDLLIAGTALARGLVLVTSNVSEFQQVLGLNIEDWRL